MKRVAQILTTRRASLSLAISLLLILVATAFGRSIGHGFVWDDLLFVNDGEAYRNLDLQTIFFSLSANRLEYFPVRDLTYVLDFALWGRNPTGFHLSNLIYYSMTVIVVLLFTTRIVAVLQQTEGSTHVSSAKLAGFLTAALFAVHPINAEVVNFITCRNALVSGLFFLLACHAYLRHLTGPTTGRTAWYLGALACFGLALFSKATAIVLPLVLALMVVLISPQRLTRRWLGLLPFATLAGAGFLLFRAIAERTHVIPAESTAPPLSSIWSKLALAVQIPVFYLSKLLVPRGFSPDYGTGQFAFNLADRKVFLCLLVIAAATCGAVAARKRLPLIALAAAWFFATLIPVLHIFPTYPVVADRYAFLPALGICVLAAAAGAHAIALRPLPGAAIAAALVLGLTSLSFRQSGTWKNTETLWKHAIEVSPQSTKALTNLGRYYFIERGEHEKGLALFRKAQDIDHDDPNYQLFLGGLRIMRGDHRNAIDPLSRALARDPQRMETLVNLGIAYEGIGDRARALDYYRRAAYSTQADPAGNVREQALTRMRRLGG